MLIVGLDASAQNANCLTLETKGQVEESYTDAQGKPAKRLVPPGKVVPGTEVVWTITATNTCDKSVENAVIKNDVPAHTIYVTDSATGTGADITFSTNGREFKKANELIVRDADGRSRPVRADEIKSLQWLFAKALPPKSNAAVSYRTKVQ
jgi:uncharacterized repeat protein (TIGR01451 family)